MKLQYSLLAVPALATLCFVVSCSGDTDSPSTRTGAGGTAGSTTGGTAGGGAGGGTSAGGTAGTGGTAGSAGKGGGGAGGTAGTGGGGTGGTAGTGGGGTGGSSGGGAGGSGGSASLPPTFETFKGILQAQSCFGGLCHDLPEHDLVLTLDEGLYGRMIDYETDGCGPLITPGNPEQSALITLLKRDCNGIPRMPQKNCFDPDGGPDCLTDAQVAALEQWITAGALEN